MCPALGRLVGGRGVAARAGLGPCPAATGCSTRSQSSPTSIHPSAHLRNPHLRSGDRDGEARPVVVRQVAGVGAEPAEREQRAAGGVAGIFHDAARGEACRGRHDGDGGQHAPPARRSSVEIVRAAADAIGHTILVSSRERQGSCAPAVSHSRAASDQGTGLHGHREAWHGCLLRMESLQPPCIVGLHWVLVCGSPPIRLAWGSCPLALHAGRSSSCALPAL